MKQLFEGFPYDRHNNSLSKKTNKNNTSTSDKHLKYKTSMLKSIDFIFHGRGAFLKASLNSVGKYNIEHLKFHLDICYQTISMVYTFHAHRL